MHQHDGRRISIRGAAHSRGVSRPCSELALQWHTHTGAVHLQGLDTQWHTHTQGLCTCRNSSIWLHTSPRVPCWPPSAVSHLHRPFSAHPKAEQPWCRTVGPLQQDHHTTGPGLRACSTAGCCVPSDEHSRRLALPQRECVVSYVYIVWCVCMWCHMYALRRVYVWCRMYAHEVYDECT